MKGKSELASPYTTYQYPIFKEEALVFQKNLMFKEAAKTTLSLQTL